MSEYVFRDANGFGCDMSEPMFGRSETVGEFYARENDDHYGTLHEEIVRCRDCKHMHKVRDCFSSDVDERWLYVDSDECWLHASPETGALGRERTEPDGFCAWGERKDDAE